MRVKKLEKILKIVDFGTIVRGQGGRGVVEWG